jgi:hypothetical protein
MMMSNQPKAVSVSAKKNSTLTTKHVVLILGAIVIVCAAVIIGILIMRSMSMDAAQMSRGNLVVDENNLADIQRELDEKVAKGMFETHMNTTWTFPDGESASIDAIMGNAPSNNYPFWFEVILSDTGETVYTSSLMPVGTQLQEIKLAQNLDQGEYPAVMTIHLIDEDGSEVESNMGFNITLMIKN